MRGSLIFIAKLTVTVGLLAAIIAHLDISVFAEEFARALGPWLAAAFVTYVLAIVISTVKWNGLLRVLHLRVGIWELAQVYTIGFFASRFLPGVIGGDALRWHLTAKLTGARVEVAASILVERVTGVVTLIVMCACALVIVPEFASLPLLLLLGGSGAATIVALSVALNRNLVIRATVQLRRLGLRSMSRIGYKLYRALRRFGLPALLVAVGWSIVFYVAAGAVLWMICKAFGASVSVAEAIAEQLYICLLIMIPISLGGLGLAQAGDLYLFGALGVGAASALGISIVRQLIAYSYALVGAVMFLGRRGGRELNSIRQQAQSSIAQVRGG